MTSEELMAMLRTGLTPNDPSVDRSEGKLVIKGSRTDSSRIVDRFQVEGHEFVKTAGNAIVEGVAWNDLRFVKCDLSRYKFFSCSLGNCSFESCKCHEFGFWKSEVADSTFIDCNLRDTSLGGIDIFGVHIPNRFLNVSFIRCDLRGSAHSCESYTNCRFINCRMDRVDFYGAVFENCVFEGPLKELIFWSCHPAISDVPKNHLAGCDFTNAKLDPFCLFRKIDLDEARFSSDPDMLWLPGGASDFLAWRSVLGNTNILLDNLIDDAGTPTMVSRDLLRKVFSSDQIQMLEDLATQSGVSRRM